MQQNSAECMETKPERSEVDGLRKAIRLLSPSMNDYLFLLDFEEDLYTLSPKAAERFCVPAAEFYDLTGNLEKFVYAEDLPLLREDIASVLNSDRTSHDLLYRWLSKDGKPIWINCRGTVVRRNGKAIYMTGCINEVGRAQQADNRSGLLSTDELRKHIEQHIPDLGDGFFLRISMDDMKGIAARFGMELADQLTAATAAFIVQSCTASERAYRLEGYEFMVANLSGGTSENARRLYRSVQDHISEMIVRNQYKTLLTISAGVVPCAEVTDPSFSAIMRQTDFVLGEAQRIGANSFCLYSDESYRHFLEYRKLRLQLIYAVEHGLQGFEVYYQPVYSVGNRRIGSAEALLRFHSEDSGMISPTKFIPILEETGLIVPVGRWVLREACRACLEIQKLIPDFHISVNVSPVQIMRSHFGKDLTSIIEEVGVNPASITCEITESEELERDSHVIKTSRQIQSSKVRLALDDFGSGYSNFRYLTDLMPNIIKVDRLFTSKAAVDPFEFKLLSVFSEMAHTLGTELVLEGVENETELEAAYLVSADYIQGFYFSQPQPFATLFRMLEGKTSWERNVRFPKLLYDQYFISDVLTEDIAAMIWINLESGGCRSMKKRTPMPLPDDSLDGLLNGIQKLGILYPMDVEGLCRFLDLNRIRRVAKKGQTKLTHCIRMMTRGEYRWIQVEITVPATYSEQFPFVLMVWRKADDQICSQQEAFRLRSMSFCRILQIDLLQDQFKDVMLPNGTSAAEQSCTDHAAQYLFSFADSGGIHPEDAQGYKDFVHPDNLRSGFLAGKTRLIHHCRRKTGEEYRWVQMDCIPCSHFSELDQTVMLYVLDIHDAYAAGLADHQKMEQMANTDALTGLKNRYCFMNLCKEYESRGRQEPLGILYADMNGLKTINDTLGHAAGDRRIQLFAKRMQELFPGRHCMRMSGDEFLVSFPGATEEEARSAAAKLRDAGNKGQLPLAAVGWAWSSACDSVDALVNEAERRMYQDKRSMKDALRQENH